MRSEEPKQRETKLNPKNMLIQAKISEEKCDVRIQIIFGVVTKVTVKHQKERGQGRGHHVTKARSMTRLLHICIRRQAKTMCNGPRSHMFGSQVVSSGRSKNPIQVPCLK